MVYVGEGEISYDIPLVHSVEVVHFFMRETGHLTPSRLRPKTDESKPIVSAFSAA